MVLECTFQGQKEVFKVGVESGFQKQISETSVREWC